jgi:hypothetical protein
VCWHTTWTTVNRDPLVRRRKLAKTEEEIGTDRERGEGGRLTKVGVSVGTQEMKTILFL